MDGFHLPNPMVIDENMFKNGNTFIEKLNIYVRSRQCSDNLNNYAAAAVLLNAIGDDALRLLNTFRLTEDEKECPKSIISTFNLYISQWKNVLLDRFIFFNRRQKLGEGFDEFIVDVVQQAKTCEFGDFEEQLLRDKIVFGILDKAVQEKLLTESNLSYSAAARICRKSEIEKFHKRKIRNILQLFNVTDVPEEDEKCRTCVSTNLECRTNIVLDRFIFFNRSQQPNESFDEFMIELDRLIKKCDFGSMNDEMFRDKIIYGISDKHLKEKLLMTPELTLETAIDICMFKLHNLELKSTQLEMERNEILNDCIESHPGNNIHSSVGQPGKSEKTTDPAPVNSEPKRYTLELLFRLRASPLAHGEVCIPEKSRCYIFNILQNFESVNNKEENPSLLEITKRKCPPMILKKYVVYDDPEEFIKTENLSKHKNKMESDENLSKNVSLVSDIEMQSTTTNNQSKSSSDKATKPGGNRSSRRAAEFRKRKSTEFITDVRIEMNLNKSVTEIISGPRRYTLEILFELKTIPLSNQEVRIPLQLHRSLSRSASSKSIRELETKEPLLRQKETVRSKSLQPNNIPSSTTAVVVEKPVATQPETKKTDITTQPSFMSGPRRYTLEFLFQLKTSPFSNKEVRIPQQIRHCILPGSISSHKNQQGMPKDRTLLVKALSIPKDDVQLRTTKNAWKPNKLSMATEDYSVVGKRTRELNKSVTGILNKLTPTNFDKLTNKFINIQIDTLDRLKRVIQLIFEKAIREQLYSEMYAKMCSVLGNYFSDLKYITKMGSNTDFRVLLIYRCQTQFKKCLMKEKGQLLLFEEKRRKNREISVGICKFISELFKLDVISTGFMMNCINECLKMKHTNDKSLECLCKLFSTGGKHLEKKKGKEVLDQYFKQMKYLSVKKDSKVSSRIRFMLQDVIDLRENKWIPRQEENRPKTTIEQINNEIEMNETDKQEETKERLVNYRFSDADRNPSSRVIDGYTKLQNSAPELQAPKLISPDVVQASIPSTAPLIVEHVMSSEVEQKCKNITDEFEGHNNLERPDYLFVPAESSCKNEILKCLDNPVQIDVIAIKMGATEPERKTRNDFLTFIQDLTTAIIEVSLINNKQLNTKLMERYEVYLRVYIDNEEMVELKCLDAVQMQMNRLQYPEGLMFRIFEKLCDDKIISTAGMLKWMERA